MKKAAKVLVRCSYTGLIIITAFLLLGDLRADAPGNIDHSAGMVFDPPSKCQTARNKVLYGEWRTDEWTPYLHGLLHTLIQTAVFSVFGSSMITMRLPGAFLFLIALLLIAEMIARRKGRTAGLIAFALAAINPITLAYGRSGLLEPQLIFWVILSAWSLDRAWDVQNNDEKHQRIWLFIAGLAASAAFWTKGMGVYFLIAAIILLLVCPPGRRRNTIFFFIPVLISIAIYAGPFMSINKPFFEREADYWIKRAQNSDMWDLWARQPIFHQLGPSRWLLAFGLLAIPLTWVKQKKLSDIPIGLRSLGVMMIIGLQATAFMQYRPLRYYALIFVASIPLTAWLMAHTCAWAKNPLAVSTEKSTRRSAVLFVLTFILLTYAINFSVVYPLAANQLKQITLAIHWRLILSAGCALLLMLAWQFCGIRLTSRLAKQKLGVRVAIVGIAWSLIFIPVLTQHARDIRIYTLSREHQMYHFSKQLGEDYRNMMFAGTSPAFGGMENTHRPRKVTHYGLNHAVMSDPGLTHLLIPDMWGQPKYFRNAFPETWSRAEVVDRIVISGFPHSLYALDRKPAFIDANGRIANPDRHNPAYITIAGELNYASTEPKMLTTASTRILPESQWTPVLSESFRIIERGVWSTLSSPVTRLALASEPDQLAWEHRSWKFSPGIDTEFKSSASWSVSNNTPIAVIGIRLCGTANHIICSWTPENGKEISWLVQPDQINKDTFSAVCVQLPDHVRTEKGLFSISATGDQPLRADAVLYLSEQDWNELPSSLSTSH